MPDRDRADDEAPDVPHSASPDALALVSRGEPGAEEEDEQGEEAQARSRRRSSGAELGPDDVAHAE